MPSIVESIEDVPLSELREYVDNPRIGDVDTIAQSLRKNGQYKTLTVNRGTHTGRAAEILAGNHTFQAARQLSWETIAVAWVDVDDEQAARIVLADNKTATGGSYNDELLTSLLTALPDVEGTGYTESELDKLLNRAVQLPTAHDGDHDRQPTLRPDPVAQLGDVWHLGRHRIICGDTDDPYVHDRLLGDKRPQVILTDPPYGMKLDTDWSSAKGRLGGNHSSGNTYQKVIGDDEDYDPTGVIGMYLDVEEQFWFGADYYAEHLPDKNDGSWLVWDKRTETQGDGIGAEFELVWSRKKHKRRMLRHDWFGFLSSGNAADARNRRHPTQKPVSLFVDILNQWTKPDDLVADFYGGSGTTLIAAELTGRTCYMIEMDPHYVDVVVARWEQSTGRTAQRETTEETP